ncbi:MAG: hypothetical protein OXE46_07550 [Chloroflexi bacterium]|nr:hypothetical protein [Chloroflexota bacterium]
MDKKTTLKGMWWVKGNEDDKFIGNLTCGAGYAPILEIFPKEYDFGSPKVPNGSTLYGDVFDDSRKVRAVTLLECTSSDSWGSLEVGAFLYSQRFVHADCVAIGMLLDDDEIAQVQAPQEIYLTCPGLDEYSYAHTVEYVWKDNIPPGRAYRTNDLERIVYTQPEPIVIEIDIGTITISLGQSSTPRDISSRYLIHINLPNPTPKDEVKFLIYSQFLSFLSIMTGRREYIAKHRLRIDSNQTRSGSLSIELNYGHLAHSTQETEYSILQTLLFGSEENMSKFATLFPKWRENFKFVEGLAFHYMQMIEQPTRTSLLQAFSHIETYVLERLLEKHKKGMAGILSEVIRANADYFSCSNVYAQHFPTDRVDHIATQLANFRHKGIHLKSDKECIFTPAEVYAYINLILRSIFLVEMEYPSEDIDNVIQHWYLWNQIKEK